MTRTGNDIVRLFYAFWRKTETKNYKKLSKSKKHRIVHDKRKGQSYDSLALRAAGNNLYIRTCLVGGVAINRQRSAVEGSYDLRKLTDVMIT